MIDLHAHILPGLDDGARTEDEMRLLLREAAHAGFQTIVCTPHCTEHSFLTPDAIMGALAAALAAVWQESCALQLCPGSEVDSFCVTPHNLLAGRILSLCGSGYVLMELPRTALVDISEDLKALRTGGFVPVIAHPERYVYVQQAPSLALSWVEGGALLQCNFASLLRAYGKRAQQTVELLLSHRLVHFLASDAHHPRTVYPSVQEARGRAVRLSDETYVDALTERNPAEVLANRLFQPQGYRPL